MNFNPTSIIRDFAQTIILAISVFLLCALRRWETLDLHNILSFLTLSNVCLITIFLMSVRSSVYTSLLPVFLFFVCMSEFSRTYEL